VSANEVTEPLHPLAPAVALLARLICGAHARWQAPPPTEPCVYIANHTSHLDAVVVWAALPAPLRALARPVAARDYWDQGPLRRFLAGRVFHAVLIERGGNPAEGGRREHAERVVAETSAAMGERHSLILFPEGTRGSGEEPGPFKSGLYHLCRAKPDHPVVPAWIDNAGRVLPKGEVAPVPLLASVTFGAPLRLEPDEHKRAFLERARRAVCDLRPA
jgi:1-acyl-sn-glycerol-3-phosphate acyltransferase